MLFIIAKRYKHLICHSYYLSYATLGLSILVMIGDSTAQHAKSGNASYWLYEGYYIIEHDGKHLAQRGFRMIFIGIDFLNICSIKKSQARTRVTLNELKRFKHSSCFECAHAYKSIPQSFAINRTNFDERTQNVRRDPASSGTNACVYSVYLELASSVE